MLIKYFFLLLEKYGIEYLICTNTPAVPVIKIIVCSVTPSPIISKLQILKWL
jgi:hypothetical protein